MKPRDHKAVPFGFARYVAWLVCTTDVLAHRMRTSRAAMPHRTLTQVFIVRTRRQSRPASAVRHLALVKDHFDHLRNDWMAPI